jgi:hypothetical protein
MNRTENSQKKKYKWPINTRRNAQILGHKTNANQNKLRFHPTPVKMAIINNTNNNKCW